MMRKGSGQGRGVAKALSWPIVLGFFLTAILSGFLFSPTASAAGLPLTAGSVTFSINDYGVITNEVSWNMQVETHMIYKSYLIIYHDAYPSGGGNTDVATGYGSGTGDFTIDEPNVWVQFDSIQETYSSFTQTGVSGVSNDLKIYQTAYSKAGEDWAILVWKLENIYGQDINDLRVGMNFRTRLDNTPGDDVDYWNAGDSIYYIEDETTGTTAMGLSSGDPAVPVNHYYGNPAGKAGAVDPNDDKTLYQALMTNKVHGLAAEMTSMVGWEVGTLPAGSNVTLPLVISFGTRYQDVAWAASKAQEFLVLQMTKLYITEIQDFATMDNVKIEIYNGGERSVLESEIYLSPNGLTKWTSGGWSRSIIAPGDYSVYSLGPGEAFSSTEGDRIGIYYSTGFLLDSVTFGLKGPAPDPLKDETIARYWTGTNYSKEWTRAPTPTFGAQNDRMARLDPPTIVLKEVYFNANQPNDRFIEIYYPGMSSVSTNGWTLVVDSEYLLPSVFLNTNRRYFVLRAEDLPVDFDMDDGTTNGDNVYLYDPWGRLVDEVGWTTAHVQGQSMERVDEPAQWGYDGYSDASSTEAGWRFGSPTPETISIGPDQSRMVDVGQTADYDVALKYFGSMPDYMDITFVSSLGWSTVITDAFYTPISDHDGDTIPDSDQMRVGETLDLKVRVTAPMDPQSGNINTVYVTATSSVNTNVLDVVTLRTTAVEPPYIALDKSANPDTIWGEGSLVFPQETTVTLDATGAGTPLMWYTPQDTVFVIDNSGSMQWNDPGNLRLSGAKAYVDMMKIPDRAATVRFTSDANLVNGHHLTWDYNQVKADIDLFPAASGGTNISAGMRIATDELVGYGDPSHMKVEILLTDGKNSGAGRDLVTIQEAQRAADNGIIIFTIGLLVGGQVNEALLQQIADITGGEYYRAPTADALEDIYLGIFQSVMNIAGTHIEDPINPNPMIQDALPPYIHYVPGSFRDENFNPRPPDSITTNPDGSTVLAWDVDKIFINESWITKYEVTSSLDGYVPVGIASLSRVNYTKWDNSTETVYFPDVHITVLMPEPVDPPILGITADQDDVHLSWTIPGPNISHYLIYRATDQRGFDFSTPWIDTSINSDNGVIPTRTTWNDTGAASPTPREYYYVVRGVNNLGMKSISSNTVGKWTRSFTAGMNAFSLPLDPLMVRDIEWYANSIPDTMYIDWMDTNGQWVRHWKGGLIRKPGPLTMGEGFGIYLSAPSDFTFVGSPASMIKYQEGLGSSITFRKGLTVLTDQDDAHLYWRATAGATNYSIYRATDRMAFHQQVLNPLVTLDAGITDWVDSGAIAGPSEWYYMVVPVSSGGQEGGSTYSVGVVTVLYEPGTDDMALPLKPSGMWTLDYYCENMDNVVGIVFMIKGQWRLHAREMPTGVYDPFIEQAEGYQILIEGTPSRYTYIGY
ncbi:MAG: VWA domain-containing protein [Methanomassiliicoccales archaeon]|nr:MAG: VWA domain-containing protein [Methanomassiliicoccales archaeon]